MSVVATLCGGRAVLSGSLAMFALIVATITKPAGERSRRWSAQAAERGFFLAIYPLRKKPYYPKLWLGKTKRKNLP